jgi:hypothetical protein
MILAVAVSACGGKPFNIKPRITLPNSTFNAEGQANGVVVQAAAVTDEDFLYDTFDANLILAGVYPVRVKLTNRGKQAVELNKARFEIVAAEGAERFKATDPRKAYKRLISFYGVSMYNKNAYKESQRDFTLYALDMQGRLPPGEWRDGILFFLVPNEVAIQGGLTLVTSRLGKQAQGEGAVELRLN